MASEKKLLDKETLVIKKIFNSPRMNQYTILFYMLNNPYERVCTNDFVGVLSQETNYILQSFKLLKQKGMIEMVGKYEKENMYLVPSEKYEEARDFMIDRVFRYLKNKIKSAEANVTFPEAYHSFRKISSFDQITILKRRFERIKTQLKESPNNAFLQNIKNKLELKLNAISNDIDF